MAITVNGFGGGGGGESRTGTYYLKVINAGSAVLSGLNVDNNPSPAVSSMQEMLNIDGPGRLLLLAAYGNAYHQNKLQYSGNTSETDRTNGFVRVRAAADNRVIYKACQMVRATIAADGYPGYSMDTGYKLPSLIEDPYFTAGFISGSTDVRYSSSIHLQFRPSDCPFLPGPDSQSEKRRRYIYIDELNDSISANRDIPYPASYYFHTPDDDGTKTTPDYCCSLFPDGLYFDGNLTIHAAYGIAPTSAIPNGIVALYQLFDD